MEFICQNCHKIYKSRVGLWKHNKICVPKVVEKKYICTFCHKNFSCRQSKWTHEKTCKAKKEQITASESATIKELKNELKILKLQPTIQNNIINDNRIINNYTQNIVISNSPGFEPIDHLTIEQKKFIMNKGLSSLIYLIETTNFDKLKPENHSYCVTALNDKHASMIDTKTNSIIKADKNELYDKVLAGSISKLEKLSADPAFSIEEKTKYIETVERLKNVLFVHKKGIKKYYSDINLLSYNNKDLIQETWNGLKKLDEIVISNNFGETVVQELKLDNILDSSSDIESDDEINTEKLKKFQQMYLEKKPTDNKFKTGPINIPLYESDSELSSDTDSEDEEDNEVCEIVFKGINYIVENNIAYCKTTDGQKGQVYGTYINNKLIKAKSKTKEIDV